MKKFKVLFLYPNVPMSTLVPINIPLLSAILKQNDIETHLFDTTYYYSYELKNFEKEKEKLLQLRPFNLVAQYKDNVVEDWQKTVNDFKPDLIAVTVVEDTIDLALKLLESTKDFGCKVIAGGVGATFNSDRLSSSGLINYICRGEGEDFILDVCNYLSMGISSFQKQYGLVDLNKLPYPDFDIFPDDRIVRLMNKSKYRMLQIEVDRGCAGGQCTYCCAPALKNLYTNQKYYRRKTNDRLIAELKFLKNKYKPNYFDFGSETFLLRPLSELQDLMKQYKKEIDIPFWCQTRPETITEDRLKALVMGGVSDMQFGIEHGNENFRVNWLRRKGNNDVIVRNMHLIEKYKIPYTINMILGFVHETRDLVWDSINICKNFNPKTINVYMATIYKGTWLHKIYTQEGYLTVNSKTDQLLDGNTGMKYLYLTKEEFKGLQRTFPLYARLDESFYPRIKIAEKFDEEGNKTFAELREVFVREFYQ